MRGLGVAALWFAVFLATWSGLILLTEPVLSFAWPKVEQRFKEAVKPGEIPYSFPVFVVTPGTDGEKYHRRIVFQHSLWEYKKEHPDYSFLIPDEFRDERIRVQPIGDGRQHVELKADRKSTRLNSSHIQKSRMPSSA